MPEDPKELFKDRSKERAAKNQEQQLQAPKRAHRFLSRGKRTRVFYYPACGSDFAYPLQHFSDRCDTFVFCDWTFSDENSFLEQIKKKEIKATRPRRNPDNAPDFLDFPLHQTDVRELANMEHILAEFFPKMPSMLRKFLADPPLAKGHYAELWVTTKRGAKDGPPKFVRVFWLAMEGVNLYWKLFSRNGIAPRILCIKHWGHIGGEWTRFGIWQEHLGRVVQAGPSEPELLVARKGDHDWPWTLPVAEFNDWDDKPVVMWARKKSEKE
jgi:hypothetical protein